MKVLKSHRDIHFLQWNNDDFMLDGTPSNRARFDYVSIKSMQRGDGTVHNADLLKALRESMPRDGMISPLILLVTHHKYWAEWVPTSKNFWISIPYVIQTGNNRYKVAVENGYTHISSVIFGAQVDPRAWNYLREELKRPLGQKINVGKHEGSFLGNILGITQNL